MRDTQTRWAVDGDNLSTVIQFVVDGALQAITAAEGAAVVDGAELIYRAVRGSLSGHQGLRLPMQGSVAGHCVRTREPYRIVDAATDPQVDRELAGRLNLCSAVMTPFAAQSLKDDPTQVWSGQDLRVQVADAAGLALFTVIVLAIDSPVTELAPSST